MTVRILQGDCRSVLATLPDESVHCVVTSPPYFGLRDYGVAGQIGLEPTPDAYVAELVAVFREVRRVLRKDGTVWLNLGDSYAANRSYQVSQTKHPSLDYGVSNRGFRAGNPDKNKGNSNRDGAPCPPGYKPKDLIGIPWRVAFALQADGWYLRQDIIWHKTAPMPESVRDRCTRSHEYIFLLSKSASYYYDAEAIKEPASENTHPGYSSAGLKTKLNETEFGVKPSKFDGYRPETRNRRSVWEVATQPFAEAHFATFPPALIEPCILAGCPDRACARCGAPWVRETKRVVGDDLSWQQSTGATGKHAGRIEQGLSSTKSGFNKGSKEDYYANQPRHVTLGFSPSCPCNAGTIPGTCLDPFGGAGTTGLVADRLKRSAVLIELNPQYAAMAQRRISDDAPMFSVVTLSPHPQPTEESVQCSEECAAQSRPVLERAAAARGGGE